MHINWDFLGPVSQAIDRYYQDGLPGTGSSFAYDGVPHPGTGLGITRRMPRGAVGPCPGGCPGAGLKVAWVNVWGQG